MINRGNRRQTLFHDREDYEAFIVLFWKSCALVNMRVLAFVLMPNHFHMLLQPRHAGDIPRMMQWLCTKYATHFHERHGTTGHVFQGRYRCLAVESDEHLWNAAAYIERNATRAGLVREVSEWPWGSGILLDDKDRPRWMLPLLASPERWRRELAGADTPEVLEAIRDRVRTGHPYGSPSWSYALRHDNAR